MWIEQDIEGELTRRNAEFCHEQKMISVEEMIRQFEISEGPDQSSSNCGSALE